MADPTPSGTPAPPIALTSGAPVADIALDDWCAMRSSKLGRRVEALSAFWKESQRTGLGRATPDQFEAAFAAFLARPA